MGQIILIVLLLILIFDTIRGFKRGFLKSLLLLATWLLTFAIAYSAADTVKQYVIQMFMKSEQNILTDQLAYFIAFALIVLVLKEMCIRDRSMISLAIQWLKNVFPVPVEPCSSRFSLEGK